MHVCYKFRVFITNSLNRHPIVEPYLLFIIDDVKCAILPRACIDDPKRALTSNITLTTLPATITTNTLPATITTITLPGTISISTLPTTITPITLPATITITTLPEILL